MSCWWSFAGAFPIILPVRANVNGDALSAAPQDPKPVPPREPEASACCQSGCTPCGYDLYGDAYARYDAQLAEWQARHDARVNSLKLMKLLIST